MADGRTEREAALLPTLEALIELQKRMLSSVATFADSSIESRRNWSSSLGKA